MPRFLPHQLFFGVIVVLWLVQAMTLGMSDDEAYYWVLSQKPAWGYAYHPPMVAWIMGISDGLTSWFSFLPREGRVRLGGLALSSGFFWLAIQWARAILKEEQGREIELRDLVFFLLPGLTGAGWMMVPDLPLFLAWSLCWWGSWNPQGPRASLLLFLGALIGMLSKFSALLFIFSASLTLLTRAPRDLRLRLLCWLGLGSVVASLPTLYWNSQNDWVALRYQFLERHQGGGAADWTRYLRFWVSQMILAGPALVSLIFYPRLWKEALHHSRTQALLIWILPAAGVFWLQPLFSDFKAHWALVVWWPLAFWAVTLKSRPKWLSPFQGIFSGGIILLFTLFTQWPFQSQLTQWWTGKTPDPRWDVTNDLYGWRELPQFLREKLETDAFQFPVLGSRYQTAAQAAFALAGSSVATLIARKPGETQEWPSLPEHIDDIRGSGWPLLKKPVLFVADQRYSQEPAFEQSTCLEIGSLETRRGAYLAKRIRVWKCSPDRSF